MVDHPRAGGVGLESIINVGAQVISELMLRILPMHAAGTDQRDILDPDSCLQELFDDHRNGDLARQCRTGRVVEGDPLLCELVHPPSAQSPGHKRSPGGLQRDHIITTRSDDVNLRTSVDKLPDEGHAEAGDYLIGVGHYGDRTGLHARV